MRGICLLGSTGSIGTQTLDILAAFPDRFRVTALAAATSVAMLAEQARRFHVPTVVLFDESRLPALRAALAGTGIRILFGMDGLRDVAVDPETDTVVAAMAGAAGLLPLLDAALAGKRIALANKEPVVAAGGLLMDAARRGGASLIPVDSEPSAIFQCLQGQDRGGLARLLLTASGGPLQGLMNDELAHVTPERALAHPTWRMGPKITVDSATLMNKGLEVIEASWLFSVPTDDIAIVIHPQSIVHSLVEFRDGSVLAQMGVPSMRTPIQYALGYPERLPHNWAPLDLATVGTLTFAAPDFTRFPCPALALEAARIGGTMPACMNAANEEAVTAFLAGRIGFLDIPRLVEQAMAGNNSSDGASPAINEILAADAAARRFVEELLP